MDYSYQFTDKEVMAKDQKASKWQSQESASDLSDAHSCSQLLSHTHP